MTPRFSPGKLHLEEESRLNKHDYCGDFHKTDKTLLLSLVVQFSRYGSKLKQKKKKKKKLMNKT